MNAERRCYLTIVFGTVALSCLLGICVDLITANIAVQYFSVHHPKIVPTENPWILALVWGVVASWWAGAIAGIVLASTNHRRKQPLEPPQILRWIKISCVVLWATMISIVLAVMAISSIIPIEKRPETFESDRRLVAVALAHQFEYVFAAIAMLIVAFKVWRAKPKGTIPNG